jgi:CheY-like chemotaxis protein/HPt (histidine-containing phosphotransfer) domain-containing protein
MDGQRPMSTLVTDSMVSRLLITARQKVVTGMTSISKPTPDVALQLAADLHMIAGEAAMLDRPELSKTASEGEGAARLLANGKTEALVPCMRLLRRLGYLLQEASEMQQDKASAAPRNTTNSPRKLLIVDDSPVAALALADVFEMHDFSVRAVSTIDKAIELFSSFSPAVLVSDVHMPNLDVADLCRRFRAAAGDRRVAVILVSGRTEAELRERLSEIKPDAFVSKLAGAVAVVARVSAICQDLFK